ncbi:superoxide dismutase [Elongatibacter sediminis]|uniref:Superoxide dismutase n=1 Tax=Elongatibacter sediminis TaxID=3119006 RepID=A0AAW9REK2_9GAMM
MSFELPGLPYKLDALEPHVSARTFEFHWGKHHRAYVDKLNAAVEGTDYAGASLEDVIRRSAQAGDSGVFNNAAQAWNHDFLWKSMAPDGGGEPSGALLERINGSFGDVDTFRKRFKEAAVGQFGSGWAWLVQEKDGSLAIVTTANAETPLTGEAQPLLTLDVWEHAYYLDYQNDRGGYVDTFLDHLVNWEFAGGNLK